MPDGPTVTTRSLPDGPAVTTRPLPDGLTVTTRAALPDDAAGIVVTHAACDVLIEIAKALLLSRRAAATLGGLPRDCGPDYHAAVQECERAQIRLDAALAKVTL